MLADIVKTIARWLVLVILAGGALWWLAPWRAA